MSELDLRAERQASLLRNEEASDRQLAERMATSLWLASDKVRVTTREISDALAERKSLAEYSTARVERLTLWIMEELMKRKADYQRRRTEHAAAGTPGRKVGMPTISEWLASELPATNVIELSDQELAVLVIELHDRGTAEGVITGGLHGTWYNHLKPLLGGLGWRGKLTLGGIETMKDAIDDGPTDGQQLYEPIEASSEPIEASSETNDPDREPIGLVSETAPPIAEGRVLDLLERRRRDLPDAPPMDAPRTELSLSGRWGSFTLRRFEGQPDVEITLIGRIPPAVGDKIAEVMLRHTYNALL